MLNNKQYNIELKKLSYWVNRDYQKHLGDFLIGVHADNTERAEEDLGALTNLKRTLRRTLQSQKHLDLNNTEADSFISIEKNPDFSLNVSFKLEPAKEADPGGKKFLDINVGNKVLPDKPGHDVLNVKFERADKGELDITSSKMIATALECGLAMELTASSDFAVIPKQYGTYEVKNPETSYWGVMGSIDRALKALSPNLNKTAL